MGREGAAGQGPEYPGAGKSGCPLRPGGPCLVRWRAPRGQGALPPRHPAPGARQMSPCRIAYPTAWARLRRFSRVATSCSTFLTVRSEYEVFWAISAVP